MKHPRCFNILRKIEKKLVENKFRSKKQNKQKNLSYHILKKKLFLNFQKSIDLWGTKANVEYIIFYRLWTIQVICIELNCANWKAKELNSAWSTWWIELKFEMRLLKFGHFRENACGGSIIMWWNLCRQ